MWIVSDSAMNKILGGEYKDVVNYKKENSSISVRRLYNFQSTYKSYNGFRKFYNSMLRSIINGVSYLDDNSWLAKLIGFLNV